MNTDRIIPDVSEDHPATLPVKITVIVFWGMVGVGLLASFFLLRDVEKSILAVYRADADHVAYELDELLEKHPDIGEPALIDALTSEMRGMAANGMRIAIGGRITTIGRTEADLSVLDREVRYKMPGPNQYQTAAKLSVYHPKVEATVDARRKEILFTMGGILLVFGMTLRWVLTKVLTEPFERMMRTAEAITGGHPAQRFNEGRKDEFGFLARFINRALDYVTLQKEQLQHALTRARHSEAALATEKERAEVTLHSIGDAVITTDDTGNVDYMNPAAATLTGHEPETVRGQPLTEVLKLLDEQTREPMENPASLCLRRRGIVGPRDHVVLARADGKEIDITSSAAPIHDAGGRMIGAVMVLHDISQSRAMARQLSYQASHDALTGLPNRREFERQLQAAVESAHDDPRGHSMLYLDMDQFKVVNDTCGHRAGDELLREFAELLHGLVRDTDLVARLGGDEFGLLLKHCDLAQARQVAESVLKKIRAYRFIWGGRPLDVGASIGLVAIDGRSQDVSEVLAAADVACYAAKDAGRNRLHVYLHDDSALRQRHGEMQWVARLGQALAENRFRLHSQPIVSVQTGAVHHHEILIRLLDEQGRIVPPNEFIPAAERYNLMPQIDRWVLEHTLAALKARGSRDAVVAIAINLSGQSLGDTEFLNTVIDILDASGVSPERMCFEITETAAIANLQRAARFISILSGMGCSFALDDFGSGLSSFAYLKNLKVDYLKIDGSFVKDIVTDAVDRAMVESIHHIGRALDIETIAEFVENPNVLNALRDIGVHYAQGYGIARPQPFDALFTEPARRATDA
ncbi:MAG TPA: EAL domain-containing protein [Acidiferrobacterales bacterium]